MVHILSFNLIALKVTTKTVFLMALMLVFELQTSKATGFYLQLHHLNSLKLG